MIKAIIFDLGNVIVKVNKTRQMEAFSEDCGKSVSYLTKYFKKHPLEKKFERGSITAEYFYERCKKDLNLKMDFENFRKVWCDIFELDKDVEALIMHLKEKFRLVLLSNTDEMHFEHIRNNYPIVNVFDEHVLSYKEGCRKPNPLIFIKAIQKAKTAPFNCMYFDDIIEFVFIARVLGVKAYQYESFGKLKDDLRRFKETAKVL